MKRQISLCPDLFRRICFFCLPSLVFVLFALAASYVAVFFPPARTVAAAASVSQGEAVMEVSSGRLLYEKNGDKRLPMASTTKILTAAIIIEDCDLEEEITIPREGTGIEGSSVYLKPNEKYTVRSLLYGLMLRSGNDCAVTLALHHSGSIGAFAAEMNRRAASWGAKDSHFVNPHGLPDDAHYTTAADLAHIACHAMQNPVFREIVSAKYFEENAWTNKNKMLFSYEGANGVKTGYTRQAGRCLVTGAKRGAMQLVSVVLNSPQMYRRSAELLDRAFREYTLVRLYSAEREFAVPTDDGKEICAVRGDEDKDFFYPLAAGEKIKIECEFSKPIRPPVKKGENQGKISVFLENQLIFSANLCTIKDVEKSYRDCLRETLDKF